MQTPGTRSRKGCLTCRSRHRKCDEGKPVCQLCHKTGRKCEYDSGLRWASMNRPEPMAPDHIVRTTKRKRPRWQLQQGSNQEPACSIEPTTLVGRAGSVTDNKLCSETLDSPLSGAPPLGDKSTMDAVPSPYEGGTICNDIFSEQQFTNLMASINDTDDWIGLGQDQALLASCHGMSLPSSFKATLNLDGSCDDGSRPGTEHEPLSTGGALTWTDPGLIPWLSPTLASPSEELAFSYYINDASTRIPAFDSPKNPYRKLCLVAISYPLLLQTILYVSAISMKNHDKGDEAAITHCRAQALLLLQKAAAMLETQKAAGGPKWMDHDQIFSVLSLREVTLAAYLMHIAAEVMVGSQTAGAYLQDAYSLMIELDYIDHLPQRFYARFLTQRFAMIDVVLSFLRHRKPFAPKHFVLYQPIEGVDEQEPSFRELTGCPQAVLSFLARISILANESSRDSCAHIAEAYQLESEMRLWGALRYPGPLSGNAHLLEIMPGDGAGARDVRQIQLDILGECFYWVAHLLLARRVLLDSTASGRVQLYREHLFALMDRLPAGCGPDSSLPFPFYMAAREAMSSQDREWVRRKHADMLSQYRDRSRELMMGLTEEIWRRNDYDMAAMTEESLSPHIWVNDDIYIGILDSQASHFVF